MCFLLELGCFCFVFVFYRPESYLENQGISWYNGSMWCYVKEEGIQEPSDLLGLHCDWDKLWLLL